MTLVDALKKRNEENGSKDAVGEDSEGLPVGGRCS